MPPAKRASATAPSASRSSSARRPRASARPKTPTAGSIRTAAIPPTCDGPSSTRRTRSAISCSRHSDCAASCVTVATACSSSAKVFAQAERLIRTGLADAAIVGGVDTLCGSVLFGFNSLELVSPEPLPAVRRRPPRHHHRRSRRLRAARTRTRRAWRLAARLRRIERRASHVDAASRRPRRAARAQRRAWSAPDCTPARSTTSICTARRAEERRGRSRGWSPICFPARTSRARPRAGPGTRSAPRASSRR